MIPIDVSFDDSVKLDVGLVFSDSIAKRLIVDEAITFEIAVNYRFSNKSLENRIMEQFNEVVVMKWIELFDLTSLLLFLDKIVFNNNWYFKVNNVSFKEK